MLDLLVGQSPCSASIIGRHETYQLGHRFLRFLLRLHVDAEIGEMERELGVNLPIVTGVTIYVLVPSVS